MIVQESVGVTVGYGLGATCEGTIDRESLRRVSVRGVIQQIALMTQSSPQSTRTAAVLQDVLRGDRVLDVELSHDPENELATGTPIQLDDALLPENGKGISDRESQAISLRLSEAYRGGTVL